MSQEHPEELEVIIDGAEQISAAGVGLPALIHGENRWPTAMEQPVLGIPSDFDVREVTGWSRTPELRQQDALCLQTVACSKLLLDRTDALPEDFRRRGVVLGSAYGAIESESRHTELVVEGGPDNSSPSLFRNAVSNAVLGHMAVVFRFGGFSSLVLNGAVSGLYAMGLAQQQLRARSCDVVITGATDLSSSLVRARFVRRLSSAPSTAVPLVDGSCLMLLRPRRRGESGRWSIRRQAFGRVSGANPQRGAETVVSRALRGAGNRFGDIQLALVHGPRGACFCEGSRAAEACLDLFGPREQHGLRSPGGTALPMMLNLCLALHWAPRGKIPRLIGQSSGEPLSEAATVSELVVAGIDASGAIAAAVLVHV